MKIIPTNEIEDSVARTAFAYAIMTIKNDRWATILTALFKLLFKIPSIEKDQCIEYRFEFTKDSASRTAFARVIMRTKNGGVNNIFDRKLRRRTAFDLEIQSFKSNIIFTYKGVLNAV